MTKTNNDYTSFYKFVNDVSKTHYKMLGKSEEWKPVAWRQIVKQLLNEAYEQN